MIENGIFGGVVSAKPLANGRRLASHPSHCIEGKSLAGPAPPLRGTFSTA
jgi:hypothetical protein